MVETANGDIRSAIMALQFACVASLPSGKTRKKRNAKLTTLMLESITRREQGLVLFHLLGKVLYNKRMFRSSLPQAKCSLLPTGKGDPSSSSASSKDIQKEKMLDTLIPDPPKPPAWLSDHDRRASRVDVDVRICDLSPCIIFNIITHSGALCKHSYRFRPVLAIHTPELHRICHRNRRV